MDHQDGSGYYGDYKHPQQPYESYEPQQQQQLGRSLSKGAADALAYGGGSGSSQGHHSYDGHQQSSYDEHGHQPPVMAEAYPKRPVAAMAAAFGGPRTNSTSGDSSDPFSAAGVSRTLY